MVLNETTYTQKDIAVTVAMDGQEAITFKDFAMSVSIDKSGCPAYPKASVVLKGLSLNTMERLTHLGFKSFSLKRNKINISAGEKDKTLSVVFKGEIVNAWADFNAAPSPVFKIEANCGLFPALIPQPPISVNGNQTVTGLIDQITKEIGYTLENNDITASIKDCIIDGDPVTKMRRIADAVGVDLIFDDEKVVLIKNHGTRKTQGSVPLINATNGMIGYPTFTNNGINVSTFFRPDLRIGANFKLETIVPRASGTWKITGLRHELCANDPGSQSWKTNITAIYPRW